MYEAIKQLAQKYHQETINQRRDFHHFAERGWLEIRTACQLATTLENLGYEVLVGKEIMDKDARMGLPPEAIFNINYLRAKKEGANPKYLEQVKNGMTAVAGILKNGVGPVVAIRFDIDALGLVEDSTDGHYPKQEGFSSCPLKIIFQPAEEGVRGAKSICESGFLDDVDYIFAAHIMPRVKDYDLYFGMNESFATTKLDVIYHGVSTHAAESPQFGKNALLSAANCIINLHSIPRNSDGQTRVNVGTVHAGTGRNVVPDTAKLEIEVRGVTTELNRYMEIYARDIINACALMHDTVVEIKQMGKAFALNCDEDFMNQIRNICVKEMPDLKLPPENLNPLGGSDDFSYMMEYVQVHGGKATYMKLLTDITASPHNTSFNFNEEVLNKGPRIMASIAYTLLK